MANKARRYFTCPIQVLYMMKEFGIKFTTKAGGGVWRRDLLDSVDDIIHTQKDTKLSKYYVASESEVFLESLGDTKTLKQEVGISEDIGADIAQQVENHYPIIYPTVDVAIVRLPTEEEESADSQYNYVNDNFILMGRKGATQKFSFVGGFVDKADPSYEDAAEREVYEETGWKLSKDHYSYIFSQKVEDPRYKNTKDGIMTMFFEVYTRETSLPDMDKIPDKEFKEFKWVRAHKSSLHLITDTHIPLFRQYIEDYDDEEDLTGL